MVHVVTSENIHLYQEEMEQAYRLRHHVFVTEMHWEALRRPDGRDVDQFDTPDAVHFLVLRNGEVAAYQRMLPTMKPHLLSDVMPQLCDPVACRDKVLRAPHIYEWTRYCVAPKFRGGTAVSEPASELICGLVEWGLRTGVTELVVEYDPVWITRFLELGFGVVPLGLPQIMDGRPAVAVHMTLNEETLDRCCTLRGLSGPFIEERAGTANSIPADIHI